MPSTQIRSRLVTYRASAINPDTHKRDNWTVRLVGNNKDDRRKWLMMAATAGFTGITLTRVDSDNPRNNTEAPKKDKAAIALEGLKLLDAILKARKATK